MRILNKYILLLVILSISSLVYSKPRVGGDPDIVPPRNPVPNVVIQQVLLDGNNISSWFYNTGIFNQDFRVSNTPGLMWPKGSNKFACFTAGLSIGAYVNGELREAMCSYKGEYAPGWVDNSSGAPVVKTDSRFRIYRVSGIDNNSNPDYAQWGEMVPFGAPYDDVNQNGQYDPGIDKPGRKNASLTLFACLTDGFPEEHKIGEGFGGGTQPLFVELHFTAWCYNTPGLEDIQFINWVVINKNVATWDRTYMGVTVDPDLGFAEDDYIGCDTSLNMGFCYNGDNDDAGTIYAYGPNPPAFGMDYFTSPVNFSVSPPETLGLTSFVYFTNTNTPGPTCEKDPNGEAVPAYYMLQGLKKDQTPWVVPPGGDPGLITKYTYPGDPESGSGWNEGGQGSLRGSVANCGGPNVLTGDIVSVNPVGDRRFIFNSGAENFRYNPNDTQNIVLAQFVARGSSNVNSVTKLKQLDKVAQKIFDANFNVIPPPPQPLVTTSINQISDRGTFSVTFSWTDLSESYNFWDTLFQPPDSMAFYKFQGYQIYEINKSANTLPDFTKPETINEDVKLLAIYDKIDNIGIVIDTFSVGQGPGGVEQFAPFPIIPPYRSVAPQGFPNSGISRSITITKTLYDQEYGGNSDLIYGNTYKFAILAYAVNTHPQRGQATLSNSLLSGVITITPEAPLAGTHYYYRNGDTLNNSRRDLGVMPIVKAQENLIDAKYRIKFNTPDTSYNILRSFDNFQNFEVLKSNLKITTNKVYDDSSRIFDGILFKVMRLRYTVPSPGTYDGNVGVIKDPTLSPDSIQTRLRGWEYNPPEHQYLEGSKYIVAVGKLWQSASMSVSFPSRNTYIGLQSSVAPADLRKVKIVFTGLNNAGQMAYRYLATGSTAYTYQDFKEVPFKVYEVDETDGTPNPRQLNCAFLEFPDSLGGHPDGNWQPTADSLGGKEILYIFKSDYNSNPDPFYTSKNLFLQQIQTDIMYVWSPKLLSQGANYTVNDEFVIYPYTVIRPEMSAGFPLYYEIQSRKPSIGDPNLATQNNDLDKVTVVPNPYYGFNALETPTTGSFITFRRLPKQCSIKIYTLNGDLINTLEKNDNNSTLQWNMTNLESVPIASGIYICLIDAPGIGTKVLKAAIFTAEERIDF